VMIGNGVAPAGENGSTVGVADGDPDGNPDGLEVAKNEVSKLGRSFSRGPSQAIVTMAADATRTSPNPIRRTRDRPGPPSLPIRCGATLKP
jgi:hypothetical protein